MRNYFTPENKIDCEVLIMSTRREELQERMAILSNVALQKIITEDYSEYETDAIEVAKQELNRRIINNEIIEDDCDLTNNDIIEFSVPPRPWVRYFARLFDFYIPALLFLLLILFLWATISPITYAEIFQDINSWVLGGISVVLWFFIEALLLSTWGTTPGKWIFNTKVVSTDGSKLKYSVALSRSFSMFFYGMGLSIPIVGLVTSIISYTKLMDTRTTKWDEHSHSIVITKKVSSIKILVCLAVIFTIILLFYNISDGLIVGLYMGAIIMIYVLIRLIIKKVFIKRSHEEIQTKSKNRIMSGIKKVAHTKIIATSIISTILIIITVILSINAFQYFYHQTYYINSSDDNAKNLLHAKYCDIIKGNNYVQKVEEIDMIEGYVEEKYNFCNFCKPQPPSLSSIKINVLGCKDELNKLMETADKDKDLVKVFKTLEEDANLRYGEGSFNGKWSNMTIIQHIFWNEQQKIYIDSRLGTTRDEVYQAQKRIDRTKWLNDHINKDVSFLSKKKNVFLLFK